MELKVKTIKSGLIRGVITAVIMIAITYAVVLKDLGMLRSMISATIIAVAVMASSAIYDYDVWSVKKKIIVHTIVMLITVYPVLLFSGWFDLSNLSGYFYVLLIFAFVGLINATVGFLIHKYILKSIPDNIE